MTPAPVAAATIPEISVRADPAADFNQALAQQQAQQLASQSPDRPQFGDMLFNAIDHFEHQRASLGQAMQSSAAPDSTLAGSERMLVTAYDCAIDTACLGRAGSLISGSVKSLVQAQG